MTDQCGAGQGAKGEMKGVAGVSAVSNKPRLPDYNKETNQAKEIDQKPVGVKGRYSERDGH